MSKSNSNKIPSVKSGDAQFCLLAGVAKSDITTSEKGVKTKNPLYAKALVLDDGKTKVVIIAMDVTAIGGRKISQGMLPDVGEEFLPNLRNRIQQELKIPGCNVLVNASHTHPPGRMLCNDDEQVDRTFDAVRRAMENMTEAKLGAGVGHEDWITINRNLRLKNGKQWAIRHTNPCPPDEEVASVGPIDAEIGVIRIDRMVGSPLAVIYNFACHPLFGDSQGRITANFPGVASRVIEENLGGGVMALFLQGAAGDICDVFFKDFNSPRNVEQIGTTLGLSTLKAFREIETKDAELNVISETIRLPRRTDIPERIKALKAEQDKLLESLRSTSLNFKSFLPLYIQYGLTNSIERNRNSKIKEGGHFCPPNRGLENPRSVEELTHGHDYETSSKPEYPLNYSYRYMQAEKMGSDEFTAMDSLNRKNLGKYLNNINAMEKLTRIQDDIATLEKHQEINSDSGEDTIEAEVQGIKIGDCVLITAPFEALVEIGLNVKKASPYKHTFMAAYSNGYMHYGAPAADYDKGGYEVTECMLAPEWQGIYEQQVCEIICKLSKPK
ncbi:MAG: hypothetical protein WCS96_15355 [Victivallales bacterium]